MQKHSAYPASAGTREQRGNDHRAWEPGGREKRAEERLWNTKAPDSQGFGGQLLHLCIKHGHGAIGGCGEDGSWGQPANWRMCLGEEQR